MTSRRRALAGSAGALLLATSLISVAHASGRPVPPALIVAAAATPAMAVLR